VEETRVPRENRRPAASIKIIDKQEDFNNLILTALDCGDFYVGCWAFKLHSTAQV
jgi:hypothetical protein